MPRLVVVIPCFNNRDVIGEAVTSALASRYDDFAVAVTDNGSSDGSAAVIDAIDDPRLTKHVHSTPVPKTDNWNRTYRSVPDCEYLVTLHGDDRLHPDALRLIAAAAATRPALIHGAVRLIDWAGGPLPYRAFPLSYRMAGPRFRLVQLIANVVGVVGASIRRDLFERVGGWNRDWTYMQDVDLWWRLAGAGNVHYRAEPFGDYRQPPPRANNTAFDAEYRAWYLARRAAVGSVIERRAIDATLAGFDDRVRAAERQKPYQPSGRTGGWAAVQRALRAEAALRSRLFNA